jgi:hypothetical protein
LDLVASAGFAVASGGIYFAWQGRLQFLDFSTGLSKTILKLEKPIALGLALSPDDHWLLLTERNEGRMVKKSKLIENTRTGDDPENVINVG